MIDFLIAQVTPVADVAKTTGLTGINWNTIILAFFSLLGTTVTVVVAYLVHRVNVNAKQTLDNSEVTKESAVKTAESVEKVHVAVNSERTEMLRKLEEMHAKLLNLSAEKAVLTEQALVRKGETPTEVKIVNPPTEPVPTVPVSVKIAKESKTP